MRRWSGGLIANPVRQGCRKILGAKRSCVMQSVADQLPVNHLSRAISYAHAHLGQVQEDEERRGATGLLAKFVLCHEPKVG